MNRAQRLKRVLRDEQGQDTVEFGLLAAFISIFSVVALKSIGPLLRGLYNKVLAGLSLAGR